MFELDFLAVSAAVVVVWVEAVQAAQWGILFRVFFFCRSGVREGRGRAHKTSRFGQNHILLFKFLSCKQ